MRLSNKFTFAYAILTFVVLLVSFIISYQSFIHTSVQATIGKLTNLNDTIHLQLKRDGMNAFDGEKYNHTTVKRIVKPEKMTTDIRTNRVFDTSLQSYTNNIRVTSYYPDKDRALKISSFLKVTYAEDEYLAAVLMIFIWTFVFLITLTVVVSTIVSIYILDPFYKTLKNLALFKVNKENDFEFKDNSTYEFSQLNNFVEEMMQKARSEYKALKEFNENASHELQTPLAVMKSKVDLLVQTDLETEQLRLLSEINDQIDRLSSIKKSLTLLVHLEHYQPSNTPINVSEFLNHFLDELEEMLAFKGIKVINEIDADVELIFDQELLRILCNNVFSNAMKYTVGDYIKVELNAQYLMISNPGAPPTFDPNEYFKRFIKSSGKQFSSGIGLSIVKKITDVYGYQVAYHYENELHMIKINFS